MYSSTLLGSLNRECSASLCDILTIISIHQSYFILFTSKTKPQLFSTNSLLVWFKSLNKITIRLSVCIFFAVV